MDLSIELQISHLEAGYEKHTSVILLVAAQENYRTFLRPVLTFNIVMLRSDEEKATKSLKRL